MKNLKSLLFVAGAVVAAALLIGANGGGGARPSFVASENWVALGDNAGLALTTQKGDSVGAELYLKTEGRWVRGRIENPAVLMPVTR